MRVCVCFGKGSAEIVCYIIYSLHSRSCPHPSHMYKYHFSKSLLAILLIMRDIINRVHVKSIAIIFTLSCLSTKSGIPANTKTFREH